MKPRHRRSFRRRSEAEPFRLALMRMRKELRWTQDDLAAKLGISKRTLSNWENGYWLPPPKQRLGLIASLAVAPPEHVLALADGLGLGADPSATPLLQPHRDALYGETEPPPPPRPRPSPEQLRAAMDAVVREAADMLDARPSDVRAVLVKALAACEALGASVEEARAAAAPAPKLTPNGAAP